MSSNSFGNFFCLTTFGESHGIAIGGIIDGCPAGLKIDFTFIQNELDKRKPGQSKITTQRKESDSVEFLSGILNGISTGTPIGFIIKNENQKESDYSHLEETFRPGHADFTYLQKYGLKHTAGGGRASARETACRVVAGAVAKLFLKHNKINVSAFVHSVKNIEADKNWMEKKNSLIESNKEKNLVRCPDAKAAKKMQELIEQTKKNGDTVGGVISCKIENIPAGIGEPVFDKLQAELAKAMLSINAAKGFEYGLGFDSTKIYGSEMNDIFISDKNKSIKTLSNNSGGILGGISNGMPVTFNVAFKPVSTIMQDQNSVDKNGKQIVLKGKGRHDPCVLPRAVPIVEAMAALVMADLLLRNRSSKL